MLPGGRVCVPGVRVVRVCQRTAAVVSVGRGPPPPSAPARTLGSLQEEGNKRYIVESAS